MTRPGIRSTGLLTTREVAAALYVAQDTVRGWARTGRISSVRTLGGRLRYRLAEVEALLKAAAP